MKIIHLTQFLGIGGLEKIIFHLIQEQMSNGHEVSLYVYDTQREWVPYFQKNGIKVILPTPKKEGYDFSLLPKMINELFDADVLHTHDLNPIMYLFPIYIFRKLCFFKCPRLIHTTHGLGHLEKFPRYKYFEKFLTPIANKIIGVSDKVGHFYLEELKISPTKITVIENGISIFPGSITKELKQKQKAWLSARHGLDQNRPIALSLSRIVPLKDQLFLIEAFKLRPYYQLIVVGPAGDEAYYRKLQLLEDSNIKLVGPQELVTEYNLAADLYVSASTHEGIPVAVLEAMSTETSCVVSDIPGHRTLNQFGACIDLYTLGNIEDFLNKCDDVLNQTDHKKRQEQKSLARKIVENHFSVKKMVSQYMLEYTK